MDVKSDLAAVIVTYWKDISHAHSQARSASRDLRYCLRDMRDCTWDVAVRLLNEGPAHANLPIAAGASIVAMTWNFLYNTVFEAWERRSKRGERTIIVRVLHTLGFEGGLILLLIPLFMWGYEVGPQTAFAIEAALLVFFLVYNFAFTFLFDKAVKTTEPTR